MECLKNLICSNNSDLQIQNPNHSIMQNSNILEQFCAQNWKVFVARYNLTPYDLAPSTTWK